MVQAKRAGRSRFFYGWTIVGVTSLVLFVSTTTAPPSITVFATPMIKEFGWSRTQFSGAVSVGTLAIIFVAPIIGRLLDRHGSRAIIALGAFALGASLIGLSFISGMLGFYIAFGISRMVCQGVINLGSTTAVSNWFVKRRGRAMAFINQGRSAGATLWPLLIYLIINAWGWRTAWVTLGLIAWGLIIVPALLFLRRRPEDMGLRPDGLAAGTAAPAAAEASPGPASSVVDEPQWTLGEAMRTWTLWLLTALMFIRGAVAPGTHVHLMPYLLDRGLSSGAAAIVISISSATMGVGALFWGFLAEHFKIRYCLSAVTFVATLSMLVLLIADNFLLSAIYAVLNGFTLGGIFTLEVLIFANYFGRRSIGAISGFTMPFQFVGAALGPLVSGVVFDTTGSYQAAFVVFTFAYGVASVLVLMAHPPRRALARR